MTTLRLLADDLTGALDTAAAFAGLTGPAPGFWAGAIPATLPPNAALDCATRELDRAGAIARHEQLAPALAGADIAFKKIDSLLRGHPFAELAACFRLGAWDHAVLAPAFPFQGRVTRGGCQFRRDADGGWAQAGGDMVAAMRAEGVAVRLGCPTEKLLPGVTVFDAETDADLASIVHLVRARGRRVLWSGSFGLAQAIAAHAAPPPPPAMPHPILGLFGSDQDITARQIAACAPLWQRISAATPEIAGQIRFRLARDGAALVGFDLPPRLPRHDAASHIQTIIAALLLQLEAPRTLLVAGGETLRAICGILGAKQLDVTGSMLPGVPRSVMRGGAWDGVEIVSKSGAFGDPLLLRTLLQHADIAFERTGS
jgi:uncharacterized protein YgbK (DUF1537 family)